MYPTTPGKILKCAYDGQERT